MAAGRVRATPVAVPPAPAPAVANSLDGAIAAAHAAAAMLGAAVDAAGGDCARLGVELEAKIPEVAKQDAAIAGYEDDADFIAKTTDVEAQMDASMSTLIECESDPGVKAFIDAL